MVIIYVVSFISFVLGWGLHAIFTIDDKTNYEEGYADGMDWAFSMTDEGAN